MIRLSSIKEIEEFNKICCKFECDIDLAKGKYYVDAKSLLGIFSLSLDGPVELIADTDDNDKINIMFEKFFD